ncbi:MAG: hypothetical protein OHK0039_05260 [Bacteroidia bacterium]
MKSNIAPVRLDVSKARESLRQALETDSLTLVPDPRRHLVQAYHPDGSLSHALRLPLPWPPLPAAADDLAVYLDQTDDAFDPYLIMLVQVGAAAIGYFEDGEPVLHKAVKKYMKRHGQGRSQIHYLNSRGKSKAGSRVRLANTVAFFEEINERLGDWMDSFEVGRILYSCTPQLWGLLFASRTEPPFAKTDPRLLKIPTHVHIPDHAELLRINRFAQYGWLLGALPPEESPDEAAAARHDTSEAITDDGDDYDNDYDHYYDA